MSDTTKVPESHKQITTEALKRLADEFGKDAIYVLDVVNDHGMLSTTTWGRSAADKDWAGRIGEEIERALKIGPPIVVHADFRTPTEAAQSRERAESAERLLAQADKFLSLLLTVTPVETIMALSRESETFSAASRAYLARVGTAADAKAFARRPDQPTI